MNQQGEQAIVAKCVACRSRIFFKARPELGDYVTCPECKAQLEVVALSPLRLDWLFEEDSQSTWRQPAHNPIDVER
ncbi:MAG: hypothetical protein ACK2UK_07290 [Candidatus Promineifilaceae bacterium]|jgi:lysine biosynthesis protein LysW